MISGRVLSPFEPCAVVRCYRHVPMSGVILSHRPATSPPGLGDRGEKGALAVMGRGKSRAAEAVWWLWKRFLFSWPPHRNRRRRQTFEQET